MALVIQGVGDVSKFLGVPQGMSRLYWVFNFDFYESKHS